VCVFKRDFASEGKLMIMIWIVVVRIEVQISNCRSIQSNLMLLTLITRSKILFCMKIWIVYWISIKDILFILW
jgi:hypothetical protein